MDMTTCKNNLVPVRTSCPQITRAKLAFPTSSFPLEIHLRAFIDVFTFFASTVHPHRLRRLPIHLVTAEEDSSSPPKKIVGFSAPPCCLGASPPAWIENNHHYRGTSFARSFRLRPNFLISVCTFASSCGDLHLLCINLGAAAPVAEWRVDSVGCIMRGEGFRAWNLGGSVQGGVEGVEWRA